MAKLIERVAGSNVADLLWHLPVGLIDRRLAGSLAEAPLEGIATVKVRVERHLPGASPRRPYRILCSDGTDTLMLVFFHVRGDWLAKLLPLGEERLVSGRIELFNGERQMTHPDHVVEADELESVSGAEPVYRLTAGLSGKILAKAIRSALDMVPDLPEWRVGLAMSWREALTAIHAPRALPDLAPEAPARRRLAYDELLANQLALGLVRAHQKRLPGRILQGTGALSASIEAALPFSLTGSQRFALAEIAADMASERRMLRLLQGDVGSGKTVVALLAMATAIEAGSQAALMAPTEILARQHFTTLERLAKPAGLRVALLTGRDKGKSRETLLQALAAGEIHILVGTHALFQEDVGFADLGLAVIDEQHRFGVHQRLSLAAKGRGVDVLVMTATPIPRTLMLTAYGDLDVSRLTEKPAGRKPVVTRLVQLDRLEEVIGAVARARKDGARIYWVCPLVDESETIDLANATDRHRQLAQAFGEEAVGLVHGQMKPAARDATMAAFAAGDLDILVATTVIEVGVDVPEATIMVIEHAERFGLAQLHQLRGRIGRGDRPSTCLLLYQPPLGEVATARLSTMRETEDGFVIAEEDLKLRGAGEVLGTRQSGLPEFRLADVAFHGDLLAEAREEAAAILEADPDLETERGKAIRILLYLFERDAAVRFLRSG